MGASNGTNRCRRASWLIVACMGLGGSVGPHGVAVGAESPSASLPSTRRAAQAARRRPGRPHRVSVKEWLAAGLRRDHPAFRESDEGYLPADVGIARRAPATGATDVRVQKLLFEERRSRLAKTGRPRPSDAEVRQQRSREDAAIKRLNAALRRAREKLRQLHDANDEQGMLALERALLEEQASQQPPAGR